VPSFAYTARNAGGERLSGVADALTPGALADQLASLGIVPLDIRPAAAPGAGTELLRRLRMRPPGQLDVMLFSRQIHTLLRSGVPIMRALGGLQESAQSPDMKRVIKDVRESLDTGRELSASLARQPEAFSPFYLAMVRVGELTGRLEEVFLRLFQHMEFEREVRGQVKSALRYPSFVLAVMALAITVVNLWVIPAFATVYRGMNAKLPALTEALIGFSDLMVARWPLLLVVAVGAVALVRWWVSTPGGRLAWHRLKLRLPVAGKIVRKATLARFARSFALAARSGVPIVQALTVVAQTVDNDYIAGKVAAMREGVERGESVLRSAVASGVFTPVVLQMVAVGEESGALDDMMDEIGQMYQREVEYELKGLSAQIEPILILCLGILVLILALGIFLPIWDLGTVALGKRS
jgi:MSHA biogenesis protein MshG